MSAAAATVRFPLRPDQVTADWLNRRLRDGGALTSATVTSVTIESNPLWNVAQTARLTPTYSPDVDPGAPARLFVKIRTQDDPYAHLFPGEYAFYRQTHDEELPLARCFDAQRDETTGATAILLADLGASHREEPWPLPPTMPMCEAAVTALARLHAHWWNCGDLLDGQIREVLVEREDAMAETVSRLLPSFFDVLGDRLPAERRVLINTVCERLPSLRKERLAPGNPLTRLHGDAHWWNILYPRDLARDGCIWLDWEDWRHDFGAGDLAQLIALHWYPDRRARHEDNLMATYHDALLEAGVTGYDRAALDTDYRLGHLGNLVIPVFQQQMNSPHQSWWSHLERWFMAFDDIDCRALL